MKKNKTLQHLIIAALIFAVVKLLVPPVQGLTPIGVNVIGCFLVTVYLWLTEGCNWTSVLSMALFTCSGVMTYSQVAANSWGSWVTVFVLCTMLLNFALLKQGLFKRIVVWSISRKAVEGRPWPFLCAFFVSIYVACLILDCTPAALVFLPMTIEVCEQCGYKHGEKLPKALFLGVMTVILLGLISTPISHSVPLIFLAQINNDFGDAITFADWSKYAIPTALSILVAMLLFIRFIMRPDVSKLANFDSKSARESLQPMTRTQKICAVTYIAVILSWLGPELFSKLLPGFAQWLSGVGYTFPVIIAIVVLVTCRDENGAPILDFMQATLHVDWNAIYICAVVMLLGPALTSESAGITACIGNLLGPVLGNFTSWVLLALLVATWVTIQTNFMSCLVTGQMVYNALVPLIIALNSSRISGLGFGIMIAITCCMGILTPPASGPSTVMITTDWYTTSDAFRYGAPMMVIFILAAVFVCYPLAAFVL